MIQLILAFIRSQLLTAYDAQDAYTTQTESKTIVLLTFQLILQQNF